MIKKCLLLLILASIAACAGLNGKKRGEPLEVFATRILDNGSKLFVFSLEPPRERIRQRELIPRGESQSGGRSGGSSGRPTQGQPGMDRPVNRTVSLDQQIDRKLKATLKQNEYCREGFVELERYLVNGKSSIRGECNETATDEDRASFVDG